MFHYDSIDGKAKANCQGKHYAYPKVKLIVDNLNCLPVSTWLTDTNTNNA
jgi:hypothetical protein